MRNRRNYYRVLHVQRDAPAALIKSCYRALMHTLEMHPDRGGDHWNAALLNEAYAVLSDPRRRAEYDRTLGAQTRGNAGNTSHPPDPVRAPAARSASDADGTFCVFCGRPHGPHELHCARCHSPLTMDAGWTRESSGRRAVQRQALDREVELHTEWPLRGSRSARIRDLSPGGLRLELDRPLELHAIVRLRCDVLLATAGVAHVRSESGRFAVGVEFFTLYLPELTGVFLSVSR